MESSEQNSTDSNVSISQRILAQGIEKFTPSCVVCTSAVPLKRAKGRSKDTCSPECHKVLKAYRKYVMVSGHCPACYHPSSPEERADFIKWRKARGDRRDRPGRPPRPATAITEEDLYQAYLLGCEDECTPEPKTFECFMEGWKRGMRVDGK